MDVMKSGIDTLVTMRPNSPISVIERYYDLIASTAADFEVCSSDAFEPSMRLPAQYFYDANHKIRSDIPFVSKGINSHVSLDLDQWND